MSLLLNLVLAATATTTAPTTLPTTLPATTMANKLAANKLAAGHYQLVLEMKLVTHIPLIGGQRAFARSVSAIAINDDGMVTQTNCLIVTTGGGYRVMATPLALRALPQQRYRFVVDDHDGVTADLGPIAFGYEDDDHDGDVGVAMDLKIDALGTFVIQVESSGHTRLVGVRRGDVVTGTALVVRSHQRIVSGLPIIVEGTGLVEEARFTLTPVSTAGCS